MEKFSYCRPDLAGKHWGICGKETEIKSPPGHTRERHCHCIDDRGKSSKKASLTTNLAQRKKRDPMSYGHYIRIIVEQEQTLFKDLRR